MTRPLVRPVVLALLLALVGCSSDPCADGVVPWIEIGEGWTGFADLADGATLQVERGSQGGQHVWLSLRGDGMHPGSRDLSEGLAKDDLPWISFEIESDEGIHSNENLLRQPLDEGDEGWEFVERRISFRHWVVLPDDWADIPRSEREAEMEAMEFVVRARVEDACGDTLEDERTVFLTFPDDPGN